MKNIIENIESDKEGSDSKELLVEDIMIRNVFSVNPNTSLFEALQLMCAKNIHTLPVVAENEIVGIIGRRDVINSFYVDM